MRVGCDRIRVPRSFLAAPAATHPGLSSTFPFRHHRSRLPGSCTQRGRPAYAPSSTPLTAVKQASRDYRRKSCSRRQGGWPVEQRQSRHESAGDPLCKGEKPSASCGISAATVSLTDPKEIQLQAESVLLSSCTPAASLQPLERLRKVGDQIRGVLHAHRDAHQAVADARRCALGRAHARVRRRRRPGGGWARRGGREGLRESCQGGQASGPEINIQPCGALLQRGGSCMASARRRVQRRLLL